MGKLRCVCGGDAAGKRGFEIFEEFGVEYLVVGVRVSGDDNGILEEAVAFSVQCEEGVFD